MVGAFDYHQLLWFRECGSKRLQLRGWTELVAGTADEQFRLRAIVQKLEGVDARMFTLSSYRSDRNANADGGPDSSVGAGCAQANGSAERESGEDQGQVIFGVEPIKSSAN